MARLPDVGEIDFSQSASACYNFIRAQSHPYPGAFTRFMGERLTVWRAQPVDVTYYGRPGQVTRVNAQGALVVCGDARPLLIQSVGWAGAERPAADVIKSVKTRFPAHIA